MLRSIDVSFSPPAPARSASRWRGPASPRPRRPAGRWTNRERLAAWPRSVHSRIASATSAISPASGNSRWIPTGPARPARGTRRCRRPRLIPVPCSWNDLFDDAREYLGTAWYLTDCYVPAGWSGRRVCLRVGSANYRARVWVNGTLAGEHAGGHLPFAFDITPLVKWDAPTRIAIAVDNLQKPDRVPASPGPGGGFLGSYPSTTYDFFPYAGLHRQVVLYSLPAVQVTGVRVQTTLDGDAATVTVTATSSQATGRGVVTIGEGASRLQAPLTFASGAATATLRLPSGQLWSPESPRLHDVTVTLSDGARDVDQYTVRTGFRTIAVAGRPPAAERVACLAARLRPPRGFPAARPRPGSRGARPRLRADDVDGRQLVPHVALPVFGRDLRPGRSARVPDHRRDPGREPGVRSTAKPTSPRASSSARPICASSSRATRITPQ